MVKILWVIGFVLVVSKLRCVHGDWTNGTITYSLKAVSPNPLLVPLTLIKFAATQGAVCSDGSLPGYHLSPGFGSGAKSWLVNLEGGGWCNDLKTCVFRKKTPRGSSNYMEKQIQFTGIMSDKIEENPDFYNWNKVKIRYCDSGSFTGDAYNKEGDLYFRGQRIWSAAMQELMSKGMGDANQALLAGCSAGGLASIHHCDEFRAFFPRNIRVKCLADAGLFLDAVDVAGGRSLRSYFASVVNMQGSAMNLQKTCTSQMDPTLCFFPENVLNNIRTPIFLLNTAYDVWQIQQSLAPNKADPDGYWQACKSNYSECNPKQIQFLQDFRLEMLNAVKVVSEAKQNGLFINSCFAHCQMERQDTWYGSHSPQIRNKGIAKSVGDWYFERDEVKEIDCPYPCDKTCHNMVKRKRLPNKRKTRNTRRKSSPPFP